MVNPGFAIVGDAGGSLRRTAFAQTLHALEEFPILLQSLNRNAVLRNGLGVRLAEISAKKSGFFNPEMRRFAFSSEKEQVNGLGSFSRRPL